LWGGGVFVWLTPTTRGVRGSAPPPPEGDHQEGVDSADRILCVNNLSRFPQPVELDLRRFKGVTPIECMGGVTFPPIGDLSYLLTLPGHGFYWFQLPEPRDEHSR
jgi:maltose alpha-D-glucosyltransferase / alpha-amylase